MGKVTSNFLPLPAIFAHEARNFYARRRVLVTNFIAINLFRFGPPDAAESVPGLRKSTTRVYGSIYQSR
jgi:hypothetical protein